MALRSISDTSPLVRACHTCGVADKNYSCVQCNNISFCDGCWGKWILHLPGATGWGGKPHEKVDPIFLQRLRQVLEPIRTEAEHEAELDQDRDTTWFGFVRDSSGQPTFVDYGRFSAIMTESLTRKVVDSFPQLVSFIGETGAGKSTLIKLLIDKQDLTSQGVSKYWSPVTASVQDFIPTTGDVHLYADPSSFATENPLLFADCEGLNGGEALPKALRRPSRPNNRLSNLHLRPSRDPFSTGSNRSWHTSIHSSQRSILWAKSPQTRKREYAIKHLYPKILYTFSDVVVFVMRNPRSFESTVLDKLVHWGATSLGTSLNQPVLPHAVIVLNATDHVDGVEWEPDKTTEILMTTIRDAINREPALQKYVQAWNEHGKKISSTKQLLECYYATITVIRIPSRGSYSLMGTQVEKLNNIIKTRCADSYITKKRVRLLADAERMQVYLQSAYDQLAISIKDNSINETLRNDASQIFLKIAPMVASCVMFDAARRNLLGTAPQLLSDAYAEPFKAALRSFADYHWPCSFKSHKSYGRCCNVRTSHTKGHQNINGKLIGNGSYQSDFEPGTFASKWTKTICNQLALFQDATYNLGQKISRSDIYIAAILHRQRMNNFYNGLGNASDFLSHTACFSCLREFPECPLPCGHILCLPCVQAYGRNTSRTTIELNRCPLHVRELIAEKPYVLTIKPPQAGVRVLSLDGGGIGAIVELKTLKAIEKLLGPKLPIHLFFDLIVGSSGGGLVALGIGVNGWSVDETISKFKTVAKEAFKLRDVNRIPFLEDFSAVFHGSLYKNQPLEAVLKREFSEDYLFRSRNNSQPLSPKVVVTSSSSLGQQTTIFTNYNRSEDPSKGLDYHFSRPDNPLKEIKIWEAARATFALRRLFKPFRKAETGESYTSGTAALACPVWVAHQEAQLLWNELGARPDILLSIGTGKNVRDSKRQRDRQLCRLMSNSSDCSNTQSVKISTTSLLKPLISKTGPYEDSNAISSEQIWDKFIATNIVPDDHQSINDSYRYIRVNPTLNIEIPKYDDVKRLDALDREADEILYQDIARVREAAHRLLASSFFFDKDAMSVRQTSYGYTCAGFICCRFQQSSREMQGLGDFLHGCRKGSFEPYFLIEEEDHFDSPAFGIILTEAIIRNMRRGYFNIDSIGLKVSKEHSSTKISLCLQTVPYASGSVSLPISGFPRKLVSEDSIRTTPLNGNSALFSNQYYENNDESINSRSAANLVLLSKLPRAFSSMAELPETVAPIPELQGEPKNIDKQLSELEG
ncbi:FabD/lysophospholipase-like protein [Xylariaceae sp. FL1651]|nr:FabD/lysophospholipase-like protein [Xylariaceae sp. FL1651]